MKDILKDPFFQKKLLWLNGALPAVLLLIDLKFDRLGANPPEAIIRTTGVVAIVFLALTLLVTPYSHIFNQPWVIRHRRWLGLWSFYYGCLHLISYAIFDKSGNFTEISADIYKRPFILLGFAAFLLMIPLAITSTNSMIKRVGSQNWKRLHKLTYLIALLGAFHFGLIVKSDYFYPALFTIFFVIMLVYRGIKSFKAPRRS